MRMCQPHWDALRRAIDARGLSALIAESGEKAASNLVSELEDGSTIDNFDPLMGAHNSIAANAMTFVSHRYMQSPMILLVDDPEHPERGCPICCLNWLHAEHDAHCTQPDCTYPKGETYEWMIDRAADDMVAAWQEFQGEQS